MKSASVLVDSIQLPAQRAEAAPIDTVAVGSADHIRTSFVNRSMNHVSSRVKQPDWPTSNDLSSVIDLDEIGGFDKGEGNTEGIHPEGSRVDRILLNKVSSRSNRNLRARAHPQSDMPRNTFIKAKLSKNSEGRSESTL